ncbi:hypothetical protein FVR03_01360 [Pontibacter qinzhouensis]|uniref:Uncharacterized protein n=1 Tax=Pontibacter qinzhouensis TaxID=2603253 RepID=A0A5C8KEZ8_9BACT|nr:hypothetical protein [Pontibacter qinzhouensis]TXK52392.1 hypothetical protein FVR03_01360 [Pontibacter qinzhouensis]
MIDDIQVFESISQDEDTKVESIVKLSFELSQIETLNEDAWPDWKNKDAKTDVYLKSGLSITLLANFESVLRLWKAYKHQEKKNGLQFSFN